ncbi:hypothetical protein FRC11_008656 [Ceratobasidium sp. 423]|nr:hypothetical protein FRC11_008656 [Ceratobasidium sp. 423]
MPVVSGMSEVFTDLVAMLGGPRGHPPKRPRVDDTDSQTPPRPALLAHPPSPLFSTSMTLTANEPQIFNERPVHHPNKDSEAPTILHTNDVLPHHDQDASALIEDIPNKKRRMTPRECQSCWTPSPPKWQRGPEGDNSVCEVCGLHFTHLKQARLKDIAKLPIGSKLPPLVNIKDLREYVKNIAQKTDSGLRRSKRISKTVAAVENPPVSNGGSSNGRSLPTLDEDQPPQRRRDLKVNPSPPFIQPSNAFLTSPLPMLSPTRPPPVPLTPTAFLPSPPTYYAACAQYSGSGHRFPVDLQFDPPLQASAQVAVPPSAPAATH